jgi:Tol biopolymer transport system component
MNADGSGRHQVTGPIDGWDQAYTASFGPDNETVAYLAFADAPSGIRGDIYTVHADGGGGRRLTTNEAYEPSYAGDGRIAYDRFDDIYVMNGDGSGQHMILANQTVNTIDPPQRVYTANDEPAFSPDGQTIAFTRSTTTTTYQCNPIPNCTGADRTRDVDIYLINADGSGLRRLTSTQEVDEVDSSISPDGTRVVYFYWPVEDQGDVPEETGELWIVGTDGDGAHRLLGGSNPEWSNVTGGPGRPHLRISGVPHGCARGTFRIRLPVVTSAAAPTRMIFRLDGRYHGELGRKRSLFRVFAYEAKRPGRHTLKVVVSFGPDKFRRTIHFRRC